MDDDLIAFFGIFGVTTIVILLILNSLVIPIIPEVTPQIFVLSNNDLIHKQIINMPAQIPSSISDTTPATFLFYVYNPLTKTQNITINWWIGMQLGKNYISATINDTEITPFLLAANQTAECLMSFSLRSNATIYAIEQFKNAGSNIFTLDIKSNFIQ